MEKQESLTIKDIGLLILKRFPYWTPLFALTGALIMLVCYFVSDRAVVSCVVNFSYDGIENGLAPSGSRFDERKIKDTALIYDAAQSIGRDISSDDAKKIQDALEIKGDIPENIFEDIADYETIYREGEIDKREDIRENAYFPSQYVVKFHYGRTGFSTNDASAFLEGMLSAYERYFYEQYGYNASLEQSVSSVRYEEYDYINAVDILGDRLSALRVYLSALANQDNTRFVSERTGRTFSDLVDAIDTIKSEDINWVTSYIISNNITKDRQGLSDYYLYKIEDAQREVTQRESRLRTLNEQIESYVKTNAIFLGIADSASAQEDGSVSNYEFSQHSKMYDSLISEKVSCQTAITETRERIALYQRRMERLWNGESVGDPAVVEASLERIEAKVADFLTDTRETADEFFKTVWLNRAFQVLEPPEKSSDLSLKESLRVLFIVEAMLFGTLLWRIPKAAMDMKRKKSASFPAAEEKTEEMCAKEANLT